VSPAPNVLVVRWKVSGWTERTRMGQKPPVWFSLYRWADPTIQAFAARFFAECRHPALQLTAILSARNLPRWRGVRGNPRDQPHGAHFSHTRS
jgi:hypothetical protein